ncbi:MAG: lamin tail domain-containing protein, partial [Pseudomonadota bacterium]
MFRSSIWSTMGGALALLAVQTLSGCGETKPAPPAGDVGAFGSVGLELQIAPDVLLNTIAYDISGNGFSKSGSLNVSSSTTISGRIGNIPAGVGYLITLAATDAGAAGITCQGSAPFNVTAGMTTTAMVRLQCRLPAPRTGGVLITGTVNVCPRVDSVSIEPAETTVGHSVILTGTATDVDRVPAPVTYAWTSSAGTLAGATSPLAAFTCTAPGTVSVTLSVSDGDCTDVASATVTCTAGAPAPVVVKINEVESNLGTPGDWVELINAGTGSVDVSGWIFRDSDDTHLYRIPAATTIAPGGYYVLEEAAFGFGLGAADSARLYDATGATIIDSYAWTAHAAVTYGRCPNGTGDLGATTPATKGAANACGAAGGTGGATGTGGAAGSGGSGGATGTGG